MPKPVQASSEVGTKNLWHCSGVFIVNFEKISRNAPVFPFKKENSISTKYKRNTEVLPLLQGFLCSTNEYGGGEPAVSPLLIMKVLGCGNWSINTKTFLLKLWLKFPLNKLDSVYLCRTKAILCKLCTLVKSFICHAKQLLLLNS